MSRRRPLLLPLVLAAGAVLIVGTIGSPLWGNGVFHGSELMMVQAPWQEMDPTVERTWRYGPISDTVDGTLPTRVEFAERARSGEIGLWNPYIIGGAPLGSTPTGGVWSPLNLPYLLVPAERAPALVKLAEMIAAGGFTYLFARRLRLSASASALGGIIFAGSATFVMWNNWTQPQVAVLIPALFWTAERFLQLRTLRSAIPVALATCAVAIGGFPSVAAFTFAFFVPYVVMRLIMLAPRDHSEPGNQSPRGPPPLLRLSWWTQRLPTTLVLAAAGGVGVALAGFLLLPFASHLGETDLAYRVGRGANLPFESLTTTFAPSAAGWSLDRVWLLGSNQVEVIAYVGAAAVVLALAGAALRPGPMVQRGARAFFAAATAVLVVFTFVSGEHLNRLQELPVFDSNPIGRIRAVLGFTVAVLAALGFDTLWSSWKNRQPASWTRRAGSIAVVAVGAGVLAYATWELLETARPLGERRYVAGQMAWPLVMVALTAVAAAVARWVRRPGARWALVLVPVLVAAQGAYFAGSLMPRADDEHFYPETPVHEFLDEHLGADRYASHGLTMYPGSSTVYRQRAVNGHTFYSPTWKEMLLAADPESFSRSPTHAFLDATPEVITSPVLDRMAARYYVLNPAFVPPGERAGLVPGQSHQSLQAGESLSVGAPQGPLRGVILTLASNYAGTERDSRIHVELTASDGALLASADRLLEPGTPEGPFVVSLAGEDIAIDGDMEITVSFEAGEGFVDLATSADGLPAVELVLPADDGLRLVHDTGAPVLERLEALPRIRWASHAQVLQDPDERLDALAEGVDRDTVVLSAPPADADGAPAQVDVISDAPERIEVEVSAEGAGYLTVADAIGDSWAATLDGEDVELLSADHGAVAVAVPGGEHTVVLTYDPDNRSAGIALSAVAVAVIAAAWFVGGRWRCGHWNPIPQAASGNLDQPDQDPTLRNTEPQ